MDKGNLIITRRPRESIRIGDDIEVTILKVSGNQVRISIKAPKDTTILRQEVKDNG